MNNIGDTKEAERKIMNNTRKFMSPERMEGVDGKRELEIIKNSLSHNKSLSDS